jgi:hypothetical protein
MHIMFGTNRNITQSYAKYIYEHKLKRNAHLKYIAHIITHKSKLSSNIDVAKRLKCSSGQNSIDMSYKLYDCLISLNLLELLL